ncbi:MAG: helix-turn-helix domain-containing protein [Flavobacteriales bacterium]|nr:helix-turn-helix domain-containing protein [Flavobacteriales bacterium]
MENPFEQILERLDRIEKAINSINIPTTIPVNKAPMGVKELSEYLKLSDSAIYKLTSTSQIPHYKSGKKLYFKKEDIDDWIFSSRIKTIDEVANETMEYIEKKRKNL